MAELPFAKPWLGQGETAGVRRVLASGWITQGPETAAFEREFAAYAGARHACAVSSCTTAMHLALLAAGVTSGDEVITVSHSFIATANSIRIAGGIPVFVDIEPDTYNIDARKIEPLITRKSRAILCVHQLGMPCDISSVLKVAKKHGLAVIEDAACAIGSRIRRNGKWERIGAPQGDAACFSFHPRKILTTGDGGMITTRHTLWDRKFRLWRQHGMTVSDRVRHRVSKVIFEAYDSLGYNYRMTDLQAAIGRHQLKRMNVMIKRRRALAEHYRRLLSRIPGLGLPSEPQWAESNWQSYCVRLPRSVSQKRVMQALLDEGIPTRRGVMCAHREGAYRLQPWKGGSLTESEKAQDHCVLLPFFTQMKLNEQARVARSLQRILTSGDR